LQVSGYKFTYCHRRLKGARMGSPITTHRSPITDHQSPITNHRSNHQSPITNQSPIKSPITDH